MNEKVLIGVQIEPQKRDAFKVVCDKEHRSMAKTIEYLIEKYIAEHEA